MAKISYIETAAANATNNNFTIPTDESVGAMLFDISGFESPFNGYPLLFSKFSENKVVRITNMDDASLVGIVNDGFLNGILYHHVSQFYDYIGGDQVLYIMLADCSVNWDAIQQLHSQTNGKEFQIGIWTAQSIWERKNDKSIGFTSLITDIQSQADEINGKVGEPTQTLAPVSLLLFGNTAYIDGRTFSYKELPDAIELNCPKVSVFLAQNGSSQNKNLQLRNPNIAPVGVLGLAMACLAICGVEESIASLEKCDLNKNEGFNYPEWGVGPGGCPIEEINRIWCNIISDRGYIIPIDYEGEEASYFFSSDQTLSSGDYSSIANNRVMHKCRRAMGTALLPYLHSSHILDPVSRTISNSAVSIITSAVTGIIDAVMRNRMGQNQINNRQLTFQQVEDMAETDTISLRLTVAPANYSGYISEDVSHEIR